MFCYFIVNYYLDTIHERANCDQLSIELNEASLIEESCIIENEDPIENTHTLTVESSDSELDESKIK